jgi:hypothetical protein
MGVTLQHKGTLAGSPDGSDQPSAAGLRDNAAGRRSPFSLATLSITLRAAARDNNPKRQRGHEMHVALSRPDLYADRSEVREGEIEQLELMEEIELPVQDQQFKTAGQPFDPRNDMGADLTTLYEDQSMGLKLRNKVSFHPIPSVIYQLVTGE